MSDRAMIIALLRDGPLAVRQSTLDAWCEAIRSAPDLTARTPVRTAPSRNPSGTLGSFSIVGPIVYRPNILSLLFGGTSIIEARRALADLLEDARVDTIVIEFDTPGGEVTGLVEFAAELRAARHKKPVIAVVNTMACSAGYWLAAQCSELIVTPSAEVGSVGVFMVHGDFSAMNERIGYRPTYIGTPRFKAEGNSDAPLSDETRQYLQSQVDRAYDQFVADIVRGRGQSLTVERVRKTFGEGRVVDAEDAVRRKMADRLFVTTPEALSYAADFYRSARLAADLEYMDMGIRIAERM